MAKIIFMSIIGGRCQLLGDRRVNEYEALVEWQ
jgi:hypothetical protein